MPKNAKIDEQISKKFKQSKYIISTAEHGRNGSFVHILCVCSHLFAANHIIMYLCLEIERWTCWLTYNFPDICIDFVFRLALTLFDYAFVYLALPFSFAAFSVLFWVLSNMKMNAKSEKNKYIIFHFSFRYTNKCRHMPNISNGLMLLFLSLFYFHSGCAL